MDHFKCTSHLIWWQSPVQTALWQKCGHFKRNSVNFSKREILCRNLILTHQCQIPHQFVTFRSETIGSIELKVSIRGNHIESLDPMNILLQSLSVLSYRLLRDLLWSWLIQKWRKLICLCWNSTVIPLFISRRPQIWLRPQEQFLESSCTIDFDISVKIHSW